MRVASRARSTLPTMLLTARRGDSFILAPMFFISWAPPNSLSMTVFDKWIGASFLLCLARRSSVSSSFFKFSRIDGSDIPISKKCLIVLTWSLGYLPVIKSSKVLYKTYWLLKPSTDFMPSISFLTANTKRCQDVPIFMVNNFSAFTAQYSDGLANWYRASFL